MQGKRRALAKLCGHLRLPYGPLFARVGPSSPLPGCKTTYLTWLRRSGRKRALRCGSNGESSNLPTQTLAWSNHTRWE
jgi:hypothetical protein